MTKVTKNGLYGVENTTGVAIQCYLEEIIENIVENGDIEVQALADEQLASIILLEALKTIKFEEILAHIKSCKKVF